MDGGGGKIEREVGGGDDGERERPFYQVLPKLYSM